MPEQSRYRTVSFVQHFLARARDVCSKLLDCCGFRGKRPELGGCLPELGGCFLSPSCIRLKQTSLVFTPISNIRGTQNHQQLVAVFAVQPLHMSVRPSVPSEISAGKVLEYPLDIWTSKAAASRKECKRREALTSARVDRCQLLAALPAGEKPHVFDRFASLIHTQRKDDVST